MSRINSRKSRKGGNEIKERRTKIKGRKETEQR